MTQAILAVSYADVPGFPAGSAVANVVASISGASSVSQTVPPGTAAVTFADLPAGDYSYSVSAVDASGAVLGTPVTGTFTVAVVDTTVTLSLPSTVGVTQV